jgi:hypothetical protein
MYLIVRYLNIHKTLFLSNYFLLFYFELRLLGNIHSPFRPGEGILFDQPFPADDFRVRFPNPGRHSVCPGLDYAGLSGRFRFRPSSFPH